MLIVTTENIAGYKIIESLGISQGSIVKSKNFGSDFGAGLKSLVGGELKGYTDLMHSARSEAEERLIENAKSMGADAIVVARYTTSTIVGGASEILITGTAVKIVKEEN